MKDLKCAMIIDDKISAGIKASYERGDIEGSLCFLSGWIEHILPKSSKGLMELVKQNREERRKNEPSGMCEDD